jgi:threonine dehydratase
MTPLELAPEAIGGDRPVYLKREDLHLLGAFKWRGALPTLQGYRERGEAGVVTASTGNHGAAAAWAGQRLGMRVIVFAPESASASKLALIQSYGAAVRLVGRDFDEAKEAASAFAARERLPFFEDGSEPGQYEGYRSIAAEIWEQCRQPPSAVLVPVGNGALIAGIGIEAKERSHGKARVVGVAAKQAPVMALSFDARGPVVCDRMATFADGLAVRVAIPAAVDAVNRVVDQFVQVSEREIARALALYAAAGIRTEGAAAAALAALPKVPDLPGPIVIIVTGRNIDHDLFERARTRPESFSD